MAIVKRKMYLINPKFQLKFSMYVCLLVFISSIIYPITIFDLMTSFVELMSSKSAELAGQLASKKQSLVLILVLWQMGFIALVFIICIFFSHKIAGPIYKLRKHLFEVKNNSVQRPLFFRKGDYFAEVADEVNEALEHVAKSSQDDFIYLSEIRKYLDNLIPDVPEDKKNGLGEIVNKLDEIQSRFENL